MADTQNIETFELSIPLPSSLDTRIFIRISQLDKVIMLFLTTASPDETATSTPMGSFVYSLPDRFNPQQPLSTTLFSMESTIEFTTRLSKMIARKTGSPVYVTNSISFQNAGMGGTVEEEMEALKNILEVVLSHLRQNKTAINGAQP
ncbi:hypothetical protein Golomagni_06064 [Golovinomyces magnicellulatus]|nr:hypothetical protein Golomagni_06064 [Golovinomyces magnicellulatus]